jgi:hypothetical protein
MTRFITAPVILHARLHRRHSGESEPEHRRLGPDWSRHLGGGMATDRMATGTADMSWAALSVAATPGFVARHRAISRTIRSTTDSLRTQTPVSPASMSAIPSTRCR